MNKSNLPEPENLLQDPPLPEPNETNPEKNPDEQLSLESFHYVYILKSESHDNTHYTGLTNNLKARPECQVWKLTGGFEPEFMDLLFQTQYFLTLVSFNRVGGVKQRMYYANLAEIRLPLVSSDTQKEYIKRKAAIKENLKKAASHLIEVKKQVEKLILGTLSVEDL
jgi:hypothetical protein